MTCANAGCAAPKPAHSATATHAPAKEPPTAEARRVFATDGVKQVNCEANREAHHARAAREATSKASEVAGTADRSATSLTTSSATSGKREVGNVVGGQRDMGEILTSRA
ncbi:hypothetical protein GCM10027093_19830 [Paraburkholderia jirisanensis]